MVTQSVGATGGVDTGLGRKQHGKVTHTALTASPKTNPTGSSKDDTHPLARAQGGDTT